MKSRQSVLIAFKINDDLTNQRDFSYFVLTHTLFKKISHSSHNYFKSNTFNCGVLKKHLIEK